MYRWNPDEGGTRGSTPIELDLDACGPMVLDALITIKNEIDSTLTFRRSCREGICGSCAMSIDGVNTLACLKPIEEIEGRGADHALAAHGGGEGPRSRSDAGFCAIPRHRALAEDRHPRAARRERLQSKEERAQIDGLWECILCFCCTAGCPS